MLLRGANAVGYTNYPDNVVRAFVEAVGRRPASTSSASSTRSTGCPTSCPRIEAVREAGAIGEAAICYTGDILDPSATKYDLEYYVELAKELEKTGAHILGIKDMAGLLQAVRRRTLVKALREEVGVPIHFHTHDTAGIQAGVAT